MGNMPKKPDKGKQRERELALIALAQRIGAKDVASMTLKAVERAHVISVLNACEWQRSLAAKALGVNRRTLQRMMKETVRRKPLDPPVKPVKAKPAEPKPVKPKPAEVSQNEVAVLAKILAKRMFS
jgi:hypothetical protein